MPRLQGNLTISLSDLITFMESEYASWMDRFHLEFPDAVQPGQDTAEDRISQARGEEHERAFLCELTGSGRDVCDLKGVTDPNAAFEAMKFGREIIDNQPVVFVDELKLGQELAVGFDHIRDHKKPSDL